MRKTKPLTLAFGSEIGNKILNSYRVLFAGDSPLIIKTAGGSYISKFVEVLKRLSQLPIDIIYFGHGNPLKEKCNEVLLQSFKNVAASN
jgi:hypothetical protein